MNIVMVSVLSIGGTYIIVNIYSCFYFTLFQREILYFYSTICIWFLLVFNNSDLFLRWLRCYMQNMIHFPTLLYIKKLEVDVKMEGNVKTTEILQNTR